MSTGMTILRLAAAILATVAMAAPSIGLGAAPQREATGSQGLPAAPLTFGAFTATFGADGIAGPRSEERRVGERV